jgi:GTPase
MSESKLTQSCVVIAGSADSGKSSLISVLTNNILDDGNGSARTLIAKHPHEAERGKTSDVTTRILDFPEKDKAVTLLDTCGQSTYFGSTLHGLCGYFPDCSFLIISANNGITPMTLQHMRALVSLNIPVVVIVTRIDITPQNKYKETIDSIKKMILSMCGKNSKVEIMNNPYDENNSIKSDETEETKKNIKTKTLSQISEFQERQIYYPIISISNKTGYMLNLTREIITDLPLRDLWMNNNFIVNIFKKAIIEHVDENYIKFLINKTLYFSEMQNCIKFILHEITNKTKKSHSDPNSQTQTFMKNLASKLSFFIFGKDTENLIKRTVKDYVEKENYTEEQEKICIEYVNEILKKYENENENENLDINIQGEMKKYFIDKINNSFVFNNDNIITQYSNKKIFEYLKKNNLFENLISQLYELFENKEIVEYVKKLENKQYSSYDKIKNILPNLTTYYDSDEFENVIFKKNQELEGNVFYIDNCYNPPGIGLVVTGINRGSEIQNGNKLLIGPINKEFIEFRVKSMHNNNREITEKLGNHDRGTIAMALVKKGEIRRNQIRKGLVVISNPIMTKNVCFRFKAVIKIAAKSVSIKSGYTPILHIGTIRQPARIILEQEENNGQEVVGFNAKINGIAIVTFKFKCNPEYIEPYTVFLIRNGDIHGIGVILSILPINQDLDAKADENKISKFQK